jgi:hypothetical protein
MSIAFGEKGPSRDAASAFISVHQRSVLFCISEYKCSSAVASTKIRWPIDRGFGRNPHTIFGRRVIEL